MFEYLITRPLGWIIDFIYKGVANYGVAIVLFTIAIKLILLPLNIKSQKAMKKQQKIQPIMAQLQKKYANDKEKLQRETMKLYKENNVSMAGGCLPMLIQMPILIGLYRVIQRPITYLLGVTDWEVASVVEKVQTIRDQMVQLYPNIIGKLATTDVKMLASNSQIQLSKWSSLLNPGDEWSINFNFLGLDLSSTPSTAINYLMAGDFSHISIILLLIIPVLAIVATFLSIKITEIQTKGKNPVADDSQQNQMAKSMNLMMPIMTGFFTFTLPAGMGIYWIISSLVQVAQQVLLNYYFDKKEEDFDVKVPEKYRKKGKNS